MPDDPRNVLATLMRQTVSDEAAHHDWTYHAVRPCSMPPRPWRPGESVTGDCSKGVQFLSWWARQPDPMRQGFDPYGNSYTLWLRLQHLNDARDLLVGDVVTFGKDGDEHAARVLEADPVHGDPLLWSFGHQGAPNTYRLSQDGRPAQFLRVPLPVYVPTPDDQLRSRNDWFAWVAWRLGEGDWQHHKPADPSVRPNVPKVIPAAWWVRYAKFLARRKRPNVQRAATPAG